MIRIVAACLLAAACGRSQGIADQDLGDLVVAPKPNATPIDLDRATKDPEELSRALALPEHEVAGKLGAHTLTITTTSAVTQGTQAVSSLDDQTVVELGDAGTYHAVYTNSADYGREVTFTGGKLYLRPRYQRWHVRAPEAPDEPVQLRDQLAEGIFATWDLLQPGVELSDGGTVQVAGRTGRRIAVKLAQAPRKPAAESLAQRKWREGRSIEAAAGEIVLDAEHGVPLAVKLAGTIDFSRDGHRYAMKVSVDGAVANIGHAAAVAVPPPEEVVETPERLREVDDRDYLFKGIAPPLRKPEGSAKP